MIQLSAACTFTLQVSIIPLGRDSSALFQLAKNCLYIQHYRIFLRSLCYLHEPNQLATCFMDNTNICMISFPQRSMQIWQFHCVSTFQSVRGDAKWWVYISLWVTYWQEWHLYSLRKSPVYKAFHILEEVSILLLSPTIFHLTEMCRLQCTIPHSVWQGSLQYLHNMVDTSLKFLYHRE